MAVTVTIAVAVTVAVGTSPGSAAALLSSISFTGQDSMVDSACWTAAWVVLLDSTTITIWPMWVASTRDSVVTSRGRRIEHDDPVGVPLGQLVEQVVHCIAGQQLGGPGVGVPGRQEDRSFSMLVWSSTSPSWMSGVGQHVHEALAGRQTEDVEDRRPRARPRRSAGPVWSSSIAMLMARLMELKLLPLPGSELVIMIRLALSIAAAPLPCTLRSSGRLMIRNSSPISERGALGGHDADRIEAHRRSILDGLGAAPPARAAGSALRA